MSGVFVRGPIAPPGYSPADESKRGKCGGATRERFTHEQRLAFAESALQLICDKRVEIGHLSEFKQIEAVSKLVKIKGTSSAGVNHNNLWRWTRPDALEELRRLCAVDPSQLNSIGNHKGGRGKCKPGTQFSSRLKWCGWFEEEETCLDKRVRADRAKRLRVSSSQVYGWMLTIIAEAYALELQTDPDSADVHKRDWKNSPKWMRGFKKRKGWVLRRATNKRANSSEDLVGPMIGYVLYLRGLRRANPSTRDACWGAYGLYTTFNVDTIPTTFANQGKVTFAQFGQKRVSIQQHGAGLDKRQSSVHLNIRPRGKQVRPTLLVRGATNPVLRHLIQKRVAEMKKYAEYDVNVIFQENAWFDGDVADIWLGMLEKDMERLDLTDTKKLILADNLGTQRQEHFIQRVEGMGFTMGFGPPAGSDTWQPVDHGVGRNWQVLLGEESDEWCKTPEARTHFENKTSPSTERRRELMVIWCHKVYWKLEEQRIRQEASGIRTIFELAFLRTGSLVSANGSMVDDEIQPEGMKAVFENSTDPYYKEHGIRKFRDLLKCVDNCEHVQPVADFPSITTAQKRDDQRTLRQRFDALTESSDDRLKL